MFKNLAKKLQDLIKNYGSLGDKEVFESFIQGLSKNLKSNNIPEDIVEKIVKQVTLNLNDNKRSLSLEMCFYIALRKTFDEYRQIIDFAMEGNRKICLVGLSGAGKTTAACKLAMILKKSGWNPCVVCIDNERPAAFQQIVDFSKGAFKCFDAREDIKLIDTLTNYSHIIVDTAAIQLKDPNNIVLGQDFKKILVLDASTDTTIVSEIGKVFLNIAYIFLTKVDSSDANLLFVHAYHMFDAKTSYISDGEKIDDFEPFSSGGIAIQIVNIDPEDAAHAELTLSKKNLDDLRTTITLNTYENSLRTAAHLDDKSIFKLLQRFKSILGPESQNVMSALPQEIQDESKVLDLLRNERKHDLLKMQLNILSSMTEEEKSSGNTTFSKSRIMEIARGAGVEEKDVMNLLSNFESLKDVWKSLKIK